MFLDFYGLKEQPFGATPDPRFLYPSRTHRKAFHSLSCGIEAGCGFLALIAGPGMGKTTLVFQLLEQLEHTARAIFLFQTKCDSLELLRYLLSGLGLNATGQDIVGMHERLNRLLARELLAGRRLVLVIDESQNLDNSVLESVRLLSNFETPRAKQMQIILAGQTQLADKLSSPDLAPLKQRISILSRLEPLTREEILWYIEHRLRVAGYVGAPLFTTGALERILARSEGVPRIINNVCLNALLVGFDVGRKQINSAIVDQVLADLDVNPLKTKCAITQQEPPTPQQTPIILDLGMFEADLDLKQISSKDIAEIEIEFEDIPPDLVTQVAQQQAPTPPPKSPLSCADVVRRDYSDQKQVDLGSELEALSDFDLNPAVRKPRATQPLAPLQKAQSNQSTAQDDSSRRKQIACTRVDNAVADLGAFSPAQRAPQAERPAAHASQRKTFLSYPTASTDSMGRKAKGTLALGAALALMGLLPAYFKLGANRQPQKLPPTALIAFTSTTTAGPTVAPSSQTHTLGLKIGRIVIDAGHGGHDTGTTGPTGLMEKDICLDVALRLGQIIEQRLPNREVIFTRTEDTFVPLEDRTNIANERKADLFLSIHANSSPNLAARGVETYYLGLKGDPDMLEIAARENATAQETVSGLQELVKKIARSEKIEASREFAEDIQDSLSRSIQRTTENVKNRGVRRAPFVVLIGANMPSVLAEISFLSNPSDEQLLKKGEYCQVLAEGLFQGVLGYLRSLNGLTYHLLARNSTSGQSRADVISAAPAAVEPARKEH